MKLALRFAVGCLVSALLCVAAGVGVVVHFSQTLGARQGTVFLEIPKGWHARHMSRLLASKKLVSSDWLFYLYVRFLSGKSRQLQAGYYTFETPLTPQQIVALLQEGRPQQVRVTIPEGASKQDIARILGQAGLAKQKDVLATMHSAELLRAFAVPLVGAGAQVNIPGGVEGYLYPDTYLFDAGSTVENILHRMHERLQMAIDDEMRDRMDTMQWSVHQVLTLASLLQQETPTAHEAPRIASVFHNRLAKGMRLQCDPTVRYGLKDFIGFYPPVAYERLRKKQLRDPHPYNTYVHKKLPPGPIGCVGEQALRAVLWPEKTNLLYFVSRNDGTHVFCESYACHKRAVKRWQIDFFRNKS
ncbi:MAG: endolytic transglycosylase MltG [Myxococcota bacterium]